MQARHGLCERATLNWSSSDGEKIPKSFISMVSMLCKIQPMIVIIKKLKGCSVTGIWESVQCDRNAEEKLFYWDPEVNSATDLWMKENADTGCPRASDASRKVQETKRHGVGIDLYGLGKLFQFMLAIMPSVVSPAPECWVSLWCHWWSKNV